MSFLAWKDCVADAFLRVTGGLKCFINCYEAQKPGLGKVVFKAAGVM